jgi:hypothetical protein
LLSRRRASAKLASAIASAAHETHGVDAVVDRASIVVTEAGVFDPSAPVHSTRWLSA